ALSWFGAQSGPPMSHPGTAPMIGFAALMHRIPPGRAVGGSGALADALVAAIRTGGGTVTAGNGATGVRRANRGWRVDTADGRSLECSAVIAACHVHTTLDLLSDVLPASRID